MDMTWLLSATAFAAAMSGTPGPNNAMVAASGATFGFRRTAPHMLGIAAGFPVMVVAVALGAGDLLRAYPVLHAWLKWLGGAYLVWLAFKIATADPAPKAGRAQGSAPLGFLQAALFQWINPKAWIVAMSGIATYTGAAGTALFAQALALALIFLAVSVPTVMFWTMTGVGAARLLRRPGGLRAFNVVMAGLLILSLLPVLTGA